MPNFYRRCDYINSDGIQCETWYDAQGATFGVCPGHSGMISTDLASNSEAGSIVKNTYIEKRQEQEKLCADMTLDELELHYAKLETMIEELKMQLLTAAATRRTKLDTLTESERAERKKIRTPRTAVSSDGKVRKNAAATAKKPTLKDDPVHYMMSKHGFTEEQAKRMLGL